MIKFLISIFVHNNYVFPGDFAKFQSVTNIRTRVLLDLYFREVTVANNFPCSKILIRICHLLKKTLRVEIIITTGTAIRIKMNKNCGSYIRSVFYTYCYYNFNSCGIAFSLQRNFLLLCILTAWKV